jgi:hypothetical protein
LKTQRTGNIVEIGAIHMKGMIVFDDGGLYQASVGLENIRVDPDLFGSFIAAIQAYAKRFVGSEMKEVTYSNIRLMIGRAGPYHVVTLHTIDDEDADWNHSATINVLETEDYLLDDQHLSILRELLTGEILSPDEVETGIDTLTSIRGE